jgi:hypothetical protein
MALEKTFREFTTQLRRVHDRLEELRVTVVEDKPTANDAAIVDRFEYAVEDLFGAVDELSAAAREAQQAVGYQLDIEQARRALTKCQEQFHKFEQDFNAHLVSYESIKDLATFGAERRGEWPSWVTSVKQGIEQCREPVQNASKTLAECWEEIAERAGTSSVSVRTVNIGQKIVTAKEPQWSREEKAVP